MAGSPSVAVVGGGASGTLAAVHLLHRARALAMPLEVVMIDQYGRHALGQAYSTTDPHHLLNACVDKMSALDGDPGHLLRWAHDRGLDIAGSGYLPRQVYGRYLRDVLSAAEDRPLRVVRRVTGTASALTCDPGVRVRLSQGGHVDADAVVLALGNRTPTAWPHLADAASPRHIADPWAPNALDPICDGAPVLVLGTGLTMVDVAVTVTRAHPDTVVYAVSRHALLPRTHPYPPPSPVPVPIPDGPLGVADLLRAVRLAVKDNAGDWHGVVDGLRPQAQRLWARLTPDDQRRFLGVAARYWEVHRHRIPPATATRIADLRATGRLRVLRGQVLQATAVPDGLRAQVEADGAVRELDVGWLVNATGPGSDIARDPFLASLIAGGTARPDRLRLGLDAGLGGAVLDATGHSDGRVFTLGPMLRGSLYETTAIPEIRAQAAALASRLIEAVTVRPGRAHPESGSSERDEPPLTAPPVRQARSA
ncbi:FAD/NAD(P)-binding protein [Streptosporangium lutulentum]|uniref:NAD(P)/FAD-binding protein YdhS n=1 Tax=Streptosporangium lutulentum TaxID=1461250 RepID=A0ABT9QAA9_9ACTN|nr:FAD/NAD(P)-binding protein [Streptosporangium lutulentum]MDP9843702.1 putative NAD(P)/FAD-binding protein YdhS [Streptosporangium lutulentum]